MPDHILTTRNPLDLDESEPAATDRPDGAEKEKKNPFVKFIPLSRLGRGRKKEAARYTLLDVFRNLRLALYCVCMSFLWLVAPVIVLSHWPRVVEQVQQHVAEHVSEGERTRTQVAELVAQLVSESFHTSRQQICVHGDLWRMELTCARKCVATCWATCG